MNHEDIDKTGDSARAQGRDAGRTDGQGTQVDQTAAAHDISRAASQGVGHDRRSDPKGDGPAVVSASMTHMEMTTGPLPSSKELAGYEQTLPGAADRILRMAEDSLHAEIDYQKELIRIYSEDRKTENHVYRFTSAVFALIPAAAFVCSIVFFSLGMNPAAFISFAGSIGFIMPRIIEAFRSDGKPPKTDNDDNPGKN